MDKRVIFAVAGSGKSTWIIKYLNLEKRSLIITYTNNNVRNLKQCIIEKFGFFPDNITLLPYFSFLYSFCFRPFMSYKYKIYGINYNNNPNRYLRQDDDKYFIDGGSRVYSNRISKMIEIKGEIGNVKSRIEKYFDYLFIDEVQDLAGNDFNFLKHLSQIKIEMLFVGDFFQHTFDTSRDGTVNKNLHDDYSKYKTEFERMGLTVDTESLIKSWRCTPAVCEFITDNLGIEIQSHKHQESMVKVIVDKKEALSIFENKQIIKLFLKEHYKYPCYSRNWGDSKGENHYQDICVVLNKKTYQNFEKLSELSSQIKNKLYVACTRANRHLYLVNEEVYRDYKSC